MKRTLLWVSLIGLIVLSACSLPAASRQPTAGASTPTLSPDQMQTQINQMLTMMPTNTGQPSAEATPTLALPTVAMEEAPADGVLIVTATATQASQATATEAPAPTSTTAPAATAAGLPTVAVTPIATASAPAGPTTTPVAGDPRSRLGSPTSTDPMDNATKWIWPTGGDRYTFANFSGGKQSVTALTGTDGWRMANPAGREFYNIYVEATVNTNTCSGSDHYGLIFAVPVVHEPEQGYLFTVTCDGRYSLRRWNADIGPKGEMKWLVNWTASSAIVTGSNQTNRLGVMMVGKRLLLYANGNLLTEVQDSTFPYGYFGLVVGSDETDDFAIQVDEMSYWENPQP